MKNLFLTKTRWLVTIILLTALGSGNAWGTDYELINSTDDLVADAHYVIGSAASGSAKFMSTTSNTNNRPATSAITITNGKITATADVLVLQLQGSTGAWKFLTTNYAGTDGYLSNAASGTNNRCLVGNTQREFTITFSGDAAVITATSGSARNLLRFNSTLFACYGSGQSPVYLFKEVSSGCTAPTITTQPSEASYEVGYASPTALSVTATGTDLTYQWYSNTSESTTGASSIGGANNRSYSPSTSSTGTTYYYCVVSSGSCNTTSNIVAVNVTRTITYYVGATSYTVGGIDGATLVSTLPTNPTSCNTTLYPSFYGWKNGSISGVTTSAPTILSTEVVSSSTASNTYYAVFTDATDYSTTYTSNVTLAANGTRSTASTASINSTGYDAMKLGSSGNSGNFTITVPSGTTKLYLHALAWNGKNSNTLTLATSVGSISPNTAQTLTANSGVSGNGPTYTLSDITNDFFEYTLTNVNSAATITLSCSERCLIWGVNATSGSGGTANYTTSCASTYTVSLENSGSVTGGTFSASPTSAAANATISLTATPSSGYTFDGWTVTNSSTSATITVTNNQFTMPAANVSVNAAFCKAPSVNISCTVNSSAGFQFYPGDQVVLTATATGGAGTPSYQWNKGGTPISGAESSTYTINSAAASDAGKYTCTVTCGTACSTTSSDFELKCMQFYLKNSSGADISNHVLTKVDATHATLSLSLTGGTTYKFRVTDGCNNWFGNTGEMISSNCTNWTMPADADCRVTTSSKSATYTFNFDFSGGVLGSEMKVSVVYPSANQAAGKVIYWDNEVNNWDGSKLWYRIGKSTHNSNIQLSKVAGTANFYSVTTNQYDGFDYWHIANNEGNGNGNIFWTKGDAAKAITNAMGFEGAPVTDASVTVTPTTSHSTGGSSDNDNCEFYTYSITSGVKSYTVTSSATNCTVAMEKYNNDAGSSTTALASGGTVMPTQYIKVTVTPNTGYQFADVVVTNGTTVTAAAAGTPGVYYITGNATVTATCSLAPHTVTWYAGGTAAGNITTAGDPSTSVEHGSKVTKLPTNPDGSPCDKTFVGWTDDPNYTHGTSLLFNDVAGSPTINADASFYAVFAEVNVATGYTYIGDEGMLETGETYIFVSSKSTGSAYALKSSDLPQNNTSGVKGTAVSVTVATGIKVSAENSDLEFTCSTHTEDEMDVLVLGSSANTLRINGNGIGYGDARAYYDNTGLYGWNNSGNTFYDVYYNSTSTKFEASSSASGRVYAYKKGGTTYTGYTINCADCGTQVTVSYTAPSSGNAMAVTKGGNNVTSGSTVKTCTAQELKVTLTPAEHYSVTNFAATGVAGVSTSHVDNVYTVTIPADATGTLTLTPTFTAETPLTITLNTNGKGTFEEPSGPIYSGGSITMPSVTPTDQTCATFVGWIQGTTFSGDGTTHEAPSTIAAGASSGTLTENTTFTAVFYETETTETDAYVKVTETPASWANDHYLIVYEGGGLAFDGSLSTLDVASNGADVTISDGVIVATSALAAKEWKIALISGSNYSIQSASGKYIGNAANSNALTTSAEALANTLSISSGDFGVVSAGGAYLRYNATSGQERFRYYKSSSYSSQQAIQLYKLGVAEAETRTYTTNPACTVKYRVTVAGVTGGSPTANPKFNPEGETVTLTANPAAGYSFTSWTITKTTGGDNVTSTLLTGDKPATANTTFTMPAYDVTVTATYTKISVTSLQVKDGETVIPNSGTVNVSTGANKTLTVVVTPADAYDHSWTATVTAGGTYASISNVTSDGFRVNGLSQGDATVTVTAPNGDGEDKVVSFTVHVTDILPTEIVLKRDGSNTPIETLTMYYDETNSRGQYVKVNVSYVPTNPTNKAFTFSSAATAKVGSHAHAPASGYEVLVANGVTDAAVNCTFTSSADGSVTEVLAVTVLPILADRFVDYIHGNATQTVAARLSEDRYSIITDINTPSLTDASDSDPTSEDCETAHYHLIGWLPAATAEALWAAGTEITEATEGLVRAGVQVEATGQTWYAIWGKEQ